MKAGNKIWIWRTNILPIRCSTSSGVVTANVRFSSHAKQCDEFPTDLVRAVNAQDCVITRLENNVERRDIRDITDAVLGNIMAIILLFTTRSGELYYDLIATKWWVNSP